MAQSVLDRKIALAVSPTERARKAAREVQASYEWTDLAEADIVVVMGGDGFMLQTLHRHMRSGKPIYGMHRGTVGFLMNDFSEDGLAERLERAITTEISRSKSTKPSRMPTLPLSTPWNWKVWRVVMRNDGEATSSASRSRTSRWPSP